MFCYIALVLLFFVYCKSFNVLDRALSFPRGRKTLQSYRLFLNLQNFQQLFFSRLLAEPLVRITLSVSPAEPPFPKASAKLYPFSDSSKLFRNIFCCRLGTFSPHPAQPSVIQLNQQMLKLCCKAWFYTTKNKKHVKKPHKRLKRLFVFLRTILVL